MTTTSCASRRVEVGDDLAIADVAKAERVARDLLQQGNLLRNPGDVDGLDRLVSANDGSNRADPGECPGPAVGSHREFRVRSLDAVGAACSSRRRAQAGEGSCMKHPHAVIREDESEAGFTLIELMIVVLIIAILIAVSDPDVHGRKQRAQDRAMQSACTTH